MKVGEAAISTIIFILYYPALIIGVWLYARRKRRKLLERKRAGLLPERRLPREQPARAERPVVLVILGFIFALIPIAAFALMWFGAHYLVPVEARPYLPELPTFTRMVVRNLQFCLFFGLLIGFTATMDMLDKRRQKRRLEALGIIKARLRADQGDFSGAVESLRQAIGTTKAKEPQLEALAGYLRQLERWAEALSTLLEITSRWPRNHTSRLWKAIVLGKMGRTDEALAEVTRIIPGFIEKIEDVCTCCVFLIDVGRPELAWDWLQRAEARIHF
jgi:tetratricopeptide (TPR) repeat protein